MAGKLRNFISNRWFIIALLIWAQLISLGIIYGSYQALKKGETEGKWPTKLFADQLSGSIAQKINADLTLPPKIHELYGRTGPGEIFSFNPAASFWFYNHRDPELFYYNFNAINDTNINKNIWIQILEPTISRLVNQMKSGTYYSVFECNFGKYYLSAEIYKNEPRVIGLLTHYDQYIHAVIPLMLRDFQKYYANLALFTRKSSKSEDTPSQIYIFVHDNRGQDIGLIGDPGVYPPPMKISLFGYRNVTNFKNLDCSIELVIPFCWETLWQWSLWISIGTFILLWALTTALWIRAERRGK